VVLLDWELPGLRSNGLLSKLRTLVRTIALSGRPEQRSEALRCGVNAFVCKGDAPETLLDAVRALAGPGADEQAHQEPVRDVSGPERSNVHSRAPARREAGDERRAP